ncbi:unnamed protein product [Hermetia illucens]|uniref:Protein TsetseEP domain-containing protein n=1 Tax=Hermetia illucens TaxID=343691 RepID=A0A7R8YSS9_HERIL|nr:uncharacterized protein LOC119653003 [Hermetia illucens]CAD7083838.1 unnamed protein product [Hermetia illucens]
MKFAIVLLGLFALSAAVPQQRGVVQKVEDVVENAISKAHAELDTIVDLVKGLTTSTKNKADGFVSAAKDKINSAIAQAESQISAVVSKGGVVASCAKQNLAELDAFKTIIGKNVGNCASGLSSAIVDFEANISGQVSSLKSAISELVTIVEECTAGGKIEDVICAVTKVKEVESLVHSIITDATSAVEIARGKSSTVVDQVQTCSQETIGQATITINKFVTAVKQCE